MKREYTFVELMNGTAPVGRKYIVKVGECKTDIHNSVVRLERTKVLNAPVLKDKSDHLIMLYGAYTAPTTVYELIEEFVVIEWQEALQIMRNGGTVYADDENNPVNQFTDLCKAECYDFNDLFITTWFKKV